MLSAYGLTDPGCVRANNEDSFCILPELGLYLVADGMGGAQAGEQASKLATDFVSARIGRSPTRNGDALEQSLHEANLALMTEASRDTRLAGMGTTMVAALVTPAESNGGDRTFAVDIASVGDSRAYFADGVRMAQVTEDQTWVNEIGRKLGVDEDTMRTHPNRHVLTMAVGVSQPLRVNRYNVQMSPGTQLLLCSDGLHGVLSTEVLAEALQNPARTLESKCEYLITSARDAGGPDNITALLLSNSR